MSSIITKDGTQIYYKDCLVKTRQKRDAEGLCSWTPWLDRDSKGATQ
jgi:hypothetical protein